MRGDQETVIITNDNSSKRETWKETSTDDGKRICGSDLGRIRVWSEKDQDWRIKKLSVDVCNDKFSDLNMKFQGHNYINIARFIAYLFCNNDDREHKDCVIHLNGNNYDNRADNLQWVTKDEYKRSQNTQTKRPCMCIETGETFESIAEASKHFGIRANSIRVAIKNHSEIKGYHFEEVVDVPKPKKHKLNSFQKMLLGVKE